MDVYPLGGEAVVKKLLPSDKLLPDDQVFVDRWVVGWCNGRGWPVLEAQEEKAFCIRGTVPFVAMVANVG